MAKIVLCRIVKWNELNLSGALLAICIAHRRRCVFSQVAQCALCVADGQMPDVFRIDAECDCASVECDGESRPQRSKNANAEFDTIKV